MNEHAAGTAIRARQSLEAVVVKACEACKAPGIWVAPKSVIEIKHYAQWPGVLVEKDDPRDGKPVGDICPNCGASRDPKRLHKVLGEIWHRFRS